MKLLLTLIAVLIIAALIGLSVMGMMSKSGGAPGLISESNMPGHGGAGGGYARNGLKDSIAFSGGGMAVVWAEENSRDYLYDAMKRKETFATSGGRILVRFFAGYNFKNNYKSTDDFAQKELDWLLQIGGIDIRYGQPLGSAITLGGLRADHDAVFLGMGLSGVNALSLTGEDTDNVEDAVAFISQLRQAGDLTQLPIGRRVVVIGGGMTAIDAGVQAKLLGAEEVTIVYRRGKNAMPASAFEQDLALQKGVRLICNAAPVGIEGNGKLTAVTFAYTEMRDGKLVTTDDTFSVAADQLFKAIGQTLAGAPEALDMDGRKIAVSTDGRTSENGVWAGGDCASGGDDLTVTAVAEGRDAALDIHASLMGAS